MAYRKDGILYPSKQWYEEHNKPKTNEEMTNIGTAKTSQPKQIKPGELPSGATRDPTTGKIYYTGGLKNSTSNSSSTNEEMVNIGTKEAPLMVPKESAAYQQTTALKKVQSAFVPETPEQQERYDQLIKAGASESAARQAVGLIPTKPPPKVEESSEGGDNGALRIPKDKDKSTSNISNAKSRTDFWQKYFDDLEAERKETKEELDKQREEFENKQESWLDKLTGRKTQEEKLESEYEELGVDKAEYLKERKADIAEMESLYDSYNAKMKERDMAVAGVEGVGMPQDWIDDRKVVINNKYNAELNAMAAGINSKAAIMEAKQGNFNEARSLANEAVDAYVSDLRFEYSRYDEFVDMNMDLLESMGSEYKEFVQQQREAILQKLTIEEQEKTSVMQLMQDAKGQAGITIDDTLKEANQKYVNWLGTQPDEGGFTDFTDQEKRILLQRGIDWNTPEGYREALDMLYGDDTGEGERVWTDFELTSTIGGLQQSNATYEQVLQEIDVDPTIKNKDRAIEIAKQVYGIKEPKKEEEYTAPSPTVYDAGQSTRGGIKKIADWLQAPAKTVSEDIGTIRDLTSSFFSGLFGK
jgi:hypothetical protein